MKYWWGTNTRRLERLCSFERSRGKYLFHFEGLWGTASQRGTYIIMDIAHSMETSSFLIITILPMLIIPTLYILTILIIIWLKLHFSQAWGSLETIIVLITFIVLLIIIWFGWDYSLRRLGAPWGPSECLDTLSSQSSAGNNIFIIVTTEPRLPSQSIIMRIHPP